MATMTDVRAPLFSMPLHKQLTWWVLAFPIAMIAAIAAKNLFFLNWVHVLSGSLWTGADLFMGFMIGPVLRRLDMPARTSVIAFLVPRQLLFFPMLSLTAGTAGWYLATWLGLLVPSNPQFPWAVGALVILSLLTLQGLGVLLPNGLRIWFELQKPAPDREKIVRLNRITIAVTASQGVMQIAIIFIMAHFAHG